MTLAESRTTGWKFYQAAMRGEELNTHPAFVPIGFYRVEDRRKGKSWPLAIWESSGSKFARVGEGATLTLDKPEDEEDFAYKTFQYCCRRPIDFKVYEHWMANREWPKEVGAQAVIEASLAARDNAEPGIGDNSGRSAEIDHESFVDQVRAALSGVADLKKLGTDEQVAAANSLRNRLNELAGEGAKKHEVEKKPHLQAGREVDQRWNPIIAEAKAGAGILRKAIEDLKTEEMKAKREAAAAQAALANPVTTAPEPDRIEGNYGKRTTVKAVLVPTIVDQDAVYRQMRGNTELVYLLEKLVKKVYAAGGVLEGVTTTERAAIR